MTENAGLTLKQQEKRAIPRIIQTALIFRLNSVRIFLTLLISRMSFRPFIHQEQYSTDFWEKSFLTGRPPLLLCGKSQKIISCLIIRFLLLTLYAASTDISAENTLPVRNAAKRLRYTAVLQAITVRSRTGMTERLRNIKTEPFMTLCILP